MATLTRDELVVLARKLEAEGLSQTAIADELNKRGITNAKGSSWTRGAIYQLFREARDHEKELDKVDTVDTPALQADETQSAVNDDTLDTVSAPVSEDAPHAPVTDDKVDTITRAEVEAMLAALENRLTTIIAQNISTGDTLDKLDEPPLPPKTGKRFHGAKGDIRVRVDAVLVELFEGDVAKRFAGNASRAMDAILWSHFGKPALSFELPKDEQERLHKKYGREEKD